MLLFGSTASRKRKPIGIVASITRQRVAKSMSAANVNSNMRRTRSARQSRPDSESLPGRFLLVNLEVDEKESQMRPFGIIRFVRGNLQLDPPRDPNVIITGELWEPVDPTDLFGAYCAKLPAEEADIVQGAVLYFDEQLDSMGRPDTATCDDLISAVPGMKQAVTRYHKWAQQMEFDID
jgi:hypothetical protein